MIATEPLPASFWDEVGWDGRETFADGRHLIIYGQRTADDRIAFGGRGAPYHFGSRVRDGFDRDPATFAELRTRARRRCSPRSATRRSRTSGVGRSASRATGTARSASSRRPGSRGPAATSATAWAPSNLAGRTLADLILRRDTELTALPWVGHRSPPWEPEPLRWLGINAGLQLTAGLDRTEARTGKRAPLARADPRSHHGVTSAFRRPSNPIAREVEQPAVRVLARAGSWYAWYASHQCAAGVGEHLSPARARDAVRSSRGSGSRRAAVHGPDRARRTGRRLRRTTAPFQSLPE